jgi:hypothetical protein
MRVGSDQAAQTCEEKLSGRGDADFVNVGEQDYE